MTVPVATTEGGAGLLGWTVDGRSISVKLQLITMKCFPGYRVPMCVIEAIDSFESDRD